MSIKEAQSDRLAFPGAESAEDLARKCLVEVITPALLDDVFSIRFPWPKEAPLSSDTAAGWSGSLSPSKMDLLFDLSWPALQRLSCAPLEVRASLPEQCLVSLPPPSHAKFFTRGLGLLMLLDQCPRMFRSGSTNVRWVSALFDPMAQAVVSHLLQHGALDPQAWCTIGYDFDYYLVLTSLLLSAADHAEDPENHETLQELTSQRRRLIQARANYDDPFQEKLKRDCQDSLAFSRWMRDGLPNVVDVYAYAYLRLAIIDLHYPIIGQFERYPWRNGSLGRSSTQAEVDFLDQSGHFGESDDQVKSQLRRDIDEGTWTPFY